MTQAANAGGKPPEPAQDADASPSDARRKRKLLLALSGVAAALLLALGAGGWWFLSTTSDDGLIYANVYAGELNLGGMTPQQAKAAIHTATDDTYATQTLTVNLPDSQILLSPDITRISLNVDKLVSDAFDHGRGGSRWENYQAREQAAQSRFDLHPAKYMSINVSGIEELLNAAGETAESQLTQHTVTVTGEVPNLDRTFDEASKDGSVVHQTLTVELGTPYQALNTQALCDTILAQLEQNSFEPISAEYEVIEPEALDPEALAKEYSIQPVDALLDEKTYEVTPEVLGYGFEPKELEIALAEAKPGETVELPLHFLSPAVTGASLEKNLFQDTLAKVDTNHVNNRNRTTNLILACEKINDTILAPGEVFSFNKTVGERTAAKGYKPAAIFSGGATSDEVGGGICQVASTLYYAALQADLEIVERSEHGFVVDYVPLGMDATIYWGSLDFKFKNNTNYPIRIKAETSGGQVHVRLIGTDEKDYYVKMSYETVSGPHYGATKYKVYPEGNPQGYRDGQTIQTSYAGRTVKTYRCKYSKDTNKQISSTFEATSTYSKRDKIICVIGDPNAPKDENGKPIPTTAPPTEAPTPAPTPAPTEAPTEAPTPAPTEAPTEAPTPAPTEAPTEAPTPAPTEAPPAPEPPPES